MKKLILVATLLIGPVALANPVETWEGDGALFGIDGSQLGTYNLVVENSKQGDKIDSLVTIALPDGSTHQEQCQITEKTSEQWVSQCSSGEGGGQCYGEGLCMSYVENGNGTAHATTIVFDGPSKMRLLRTELKDGQAVKIFREKLQKR
ncbi:MAG: hypothetical protein KDD22_06780 [Bdellovibrionales bacterium]|nr:hypothetical protein [Bdellovibrionales bacterium]